MIGERTETTLVGPIRKLGGKVRVVELAEAPALAQARCAWAALSKTTVTGIPMGTVTADGLGKERHAFDMRVWLDPINAGWMTLAIAYGPQGPESDPANAAEVRRQRVMR